MIHMPCFYGLANKKTMTKSSISPNSQINLIIIIVEYIHKIKIIISNTQQKKIIKTYINYN